MGNCVEDSRYVEWKKDKISDSRRNTHQVDGVLDFDTQENLEGSK